MIFPFSHDNLQVNDATSLSLAFQKQHLRLQQQTPDIQTFQTTYNN